MATYIIGRDPDPGQPRIVILDKTVSRRHASITSASGGGYLLRDLDSTSGTFAREPGGWRRISSATVYPDDEVRFGGRVVKVSEMLRTAQDAEPAAGGGRLERDPETGQVVRRRP